MEIARSGSIPNVATSDEIAADMTGMQRFASKMWAPWAVMGLMIVGIVFIFALFFVSPAEAQYFASEKATREAAGSGSSLADQRAFIEAPGAWLPAFKFVGLGMLLGGITFLLATILGNLRAQGIRVQRSLGVDIVVPEPPTTAKLFPMLMMMGMMVLMAALVIGIWQATIAADYWNHSIATELNPAAPGSDLLAQLGTLSAVGAWLTPLKFVGMATLFTGIALALVTIVTLLRIQTRRLQEILPTIKS